MYIAFEPRQGKPNKDNSRTIRVYINHNGKSYYSTKYTVFEKDWDYKRNKIKDNNPNSQLLNSELTRIKNEIESICLKHHSLTAKEIVKLIGKKSINNFLDFFEKYITDCQSGKFQRSISTVSKYKEIKRYITDKYKERTDFDNMNMQWYQDYTGHMRQNGYNENTIGNHIKIIKSVLRHAAEIGVSENYEFQKKYFKKPSQETDSIYLTEDEILLWENVDLSGYPHLQPERDRFLIQYYFLLRFGDSLRFNKQDFSEQKEQLFLKLRSEKTLTETIVPVSTKAHSLLEKYNFKMPLITNQEANWQLKKIGDLAKIKSIVKNSGIEKEKYEFITTHTARRSGATNLYLQGVPDKIIMDLGGWKKLETFRSYIRITRLESAKKALNFEFFK